VYERYEQAGDSLVLARELGVFRSRGALSLVLAEIEKDLGPKHVPHLKRLSERPGLHSTIAKKTRELLERLGEKPKRKARRAKHQKG
jgi:hypothetical protein